jgi:hypothetical protein
MLEQIASQRGIPHRTLHTLIYSSYEASVRIPLGIERPFPTMSDFHDRETSTYRHRKAEYDKAVAALVKNVTTTAPMVRGWKTSTKSLTLYYDTLDDCRISLPSIPTATEIASVPLDVRIRQYMHENPKVLVRQDRFFNQYTYRLTVSTIKLYECKNILSGISGTPLHVLGKSRTLVVDSPQIKYTNGTSIYARDEEDLFALKIALGERILAITPVATYKEVKL